MTSSREAEIADFVAARQASLRRLAILLVLAGSNGSVPAVGLRIARAVQFHQHISVSYASRFGSLPRGWRVVGVGAKREDGVYLATIYQIAKLRTISPQSLTGSIVAAKNMPTVETIPQTTAEQCNVPKWANKPPVNINGYLLNRVVYGERGSVPGM